MDGRNFGSCSAGPRSTPARNPHFKFIKRPSQDELDWESRAEAAFGNRIRVTTGGSGMIRKSVTVGTIGETETKSSLNHANSSTFLGFPARSKNFPWLAKEMRRVLAHSPPWPTSAMKLPARLHRCSINKNGLCCCDRLTCLEVLEVLAGCFAVAAASGRGIY